jgi:hypothetical protein
VGPAIPIGAVQVTQPAVLFRKYVIEPFYPGVGGWVSLGSAVFDAPMSVVEQIPLVARVTGVYDDIPLTSIGKLNRTTALTGLVELRGQDGIQVLACIDEWPIGNDPDYLENPRYMRNLDGGPKPCIALRLEASPEKLDTLYDYTGPCQKSPSDEQCGRRMVRTINGVTPDCNGNITIEFANVPNGTLVDEDDNVIGIALDYPLGLIDVCDPNKGLQLPEPIPLCEESSSSSSMSSQSQSSGSSSSQSPTPECPDILEPTLITFDSLHCWDLYAGLWSLVDCQLVGSSLGWGLTTLHGSHTVGHDVQGFINIAPTHNRRAYLVFGAETDTKYWFLELDAYANQVVIGRRSGSTIIPESLPMAYTVPTGTYVHVRVAVDLSGYVQSWIDGVVGPAVLAAPSTLNDGTCGFAVRVSNAMFDNFALDWPVIGPGGFPTPGC